MSGYTPAGGHRPTYMLGQGSSAVRGHRPRYHGHYSRGRWVYIAERNGLIKIGMSKSPAARVAQLDARLLAAVPGNRVDEIDLHVRFETDRLHGEWFRPSWRLLCLAQSWADADNVFPDQYAYTLTDAEADEWDRYRADMQRAVVLGEDFDEGAYFGGTLVDEVAAS